MYLVARLVDDCRPAKMLPAEARTERASVARSWLASVALPTTVRAALAKLADATGEDQTLLRAALASALAAVDVYMDPSSRLELERLSRALEK
jgi:hypothetical protein